MKIGIRDFENNMLDRITMQQSIDKAWDSLSDMEAAVLYLLMMGYSREDVAEHFECSRQNVQQTIGRIRKRFLKCGVYYEVS